MGMLSNFRVYHLIAITLFFVMFSRILSALGLPKAIDFLHFPLILVCLFLAVVQMKRVTPLFVPVAGLVAAYLISGIGNNAGILNIVLGFLLMAEPIILVFVFSIIKGSEADVKSMRAFVSLIVLTHLLCSFAQFSVLNLGGDGVKGLFIGMNNGHHVGGAVSMVALVYFSASTGIKNNIYRWGICLALILQVIISDSKQVILVLMIASFLYGIFYHNRIAGVLVKLLLAALGIIFTVFLIRYVAGYSAWLNYDVFFEGIVQKISVFQLEVGYFDNWMNWIIGLGPGHTISRLGWLIPEYYQILEPLGVTYHEATIAILYENQDHWMSNSITGSSLFSLMFSYAGLWGDVGFLGMFFYLRCWGYIWGQFATGGPQKLLLISLFVFGAVFAYLEEPGLTLFLVSVVMLLKYESEHASMSTAR